MSSSTVQHTSYVPQSTSHTLPRVSTQVTKVVQYGTQVFTTLADDGGSVGIICLDKDQMSPQVSSECVRLSLVAICERQHTGSGSAPVCELTMSQAPIMTRSIVAFAMLLISHRRTGNSLFFDTLNTAVHALELSRTESANHSFSVLHWLGLAAFIVSEQESNVVCGFVYPAVTFRHEQDLQV